MHGYTFMEPSDERIRLSLNPFVEPVVCDHVNVSKFVLVVDCDFATTGYQVYIKRLPCGVVLVSSLESEHHISDRTLCVSSQEVQLLVQTLVETFKIIERVLFANKFSEKKVSKLRLYSYPFINRLSEKTSQEPKNINIFAFAKKGL